MNAKPSKPFCRTCGFYHDGPCQRRPGREYTDSCTGRPDCWCGHGYHQADPPPMRGV